MTGPLLATTVTTPVGDVGLLVDADRPGPVVVASGFATVAELAGRLAPALQARGLREVAPEDAAVRPVTAPLTAYLDGDLDALHGVTVDQPGGPFQQQVWQVMRSIPPGQAWSYAELAARAGRPTAVRAAGGACARNLVAPFVPCHRVVRSAPAGAAGPAGAASASRLGGYAYGLDTKRWLLEHEGWR